MASVHTSKIILPRRRFLSRPAPVAAERGRPGHGDYGSALTRARDPIAGSRWFGASGVRPGSDRSTAPETALSLNAIFMIYRPLDYALSGIVSRVGRLRAFTYVYVPDYGTRGGLREVRTSGIR